MSDHRHEHDEHEHDEHEHDELELDDLTSELQTLQFEVREGVAVITIDRPEALAHDPLLVRRLRRLRATRQRARSARRLGFEV